MENKNNSCFDINESDELTKLKILNSALIKELRKYKEENTKLKHETEILNSIIENLEEENKTLKSDFSSMENQNPLEETIDIVEKPGQPKSGSRAKRLSASRENKSGEEEHKNCPCPICPKILKNKKSLKYHIAFVHEKRKDHNCETCGMTFAQSTTLKRHTLNIHEKQKDYSCETCGMAFAQKVNLKTHILAIHKGIPYAKQAKLGEEENYKQIKDLLNNDDTNVNLVENHFSVQAH